MYFEIESTISFEDIELILLIQHEENIKLEDWNFGTSETNHGSFFPSFYLVNLNFYVHELNPSV